MAHMSPWDHWGLQCVRIQDNFHSSSGSHVYPTLLAPGYSHLSRWSPPTHLGWDEGRSGPLTRGIVIGRITLLSLMSASPPHPRNTGSCLLGRLRGDRHHKRLTSVSHPCGAAEKQGTSQPKA